MLQLTAPSVSELSENPLNNRYDSIVYKTSTSLENLDNNSDWEHTDQLLFFFAATIGHRDLETAEHCERLVKLAKDFGEYLQLSSLEIRDLIYGAYLHDIGKVGITDQVLLKSDKLNSDEWEIMKQHVLIGEKICQPLSSMKSILPIIRNHHERWDGSGYPDGLKGEEIPFLVQVFQIIDIYDALISNRPYKEGLTLKAAILSLQEEAKKGWRNPDLITKFSQFILGS